MGAEERPLLGDNKVTRSERLAPGQVIRKKSWMVLQQIYIKIYEYQRTETNLTRFLFTGLLLFIGLCIRAIGNVNVNQFICSGFGKIRRKILTGE